MFGFGQVFRPLDGTVAESAARPEYVPAPDPIKRAEAGIPPDSTDDAPAASSSDIRSIQVYPNIIFLSAGGQIARQIDLQRPAGTLSEIVNLVNDPDWIRNDEGVVTMSAALILEPKVSVTISAPVSKVVMEVRPGVYIGAKNAELFITGVTVEAADGNIPHDGEIGDGNRPFVVASDLSRMDIANSTFRYLGRDWHASYGVSWVRGSTGSAAGSTFEKSFIGAFTSRSRDIAFINNTFRENVLFGLDPHTSTTNLTVERNLAERNGHHGIIFADHVTGSRVRYNVVRDNGIDGIVMNFASDQNLVENNEVASNSGDGIVVSDSSANVVVGNVINGNRVGVRESGVSTQPNRFAGNIIRDNARASQEVELGDGNTIGHNGHYWRPTAVLLLIGIITVALAVGLCLLTSWCRRDRERYMLCCTEQAARLKVGAA